VGCYVENGEGDRGEVSSWRIRGEQFTEGGGGGEDVVEGCVEGFADKFDCGGGFG
jgi:hypothetical protein